MNAEGRERAVRLRVGVFVLVALVAFLAVIYLLGARARLFEARYTLHADFTEVGGLIEGATVRLAGVQIGRVSAVRLPPEPGGKVRVDLTVGRQFAPRIRRDSTVRIETQGLLGDKIVEITVGSAAAAVVQAGEVLATEDPTNLGQVLSDGATTVRRVAALSESLRQTAEALAQARVVEEAATTLRAARRLADEVTATAEAARALTARAGRLLDRVEHGPGLAHTLVHREPLELDRVNRLLASLEATLGRVERGEGAIGVLTTAESAAATRRLLAALDRLSALTEQPPGQEGLLPALMAEPRYRAMLDDLQVVARNFRDVSERLAGGRGALGSLLRDQPGPGLGTAAQDLQAALANLKSITRKLDAGEGTLGGLLADPTIYERLVEILDGTQRSFLLRSLLRGLGGGRTPEAEGQDDRPRP